MTFKDPWLLIVLPVLPVLFVLTIQKGRVARLRFPSAAMVVSFKSTWRTRLVHLPLILRFCALALMAVALSGPRTVLEETVYRSEGIDIVLAIDASGSMSAEDFVLEGKRQNRLAVVKDVVREFIDGRKNDRLGLVAFGGLAYTVCPLTTDYPWLKANLERVELGVIEDGTAIGSAISSAVARLKNSSAKSKVVILLTDGINNAGRVDPISAAQAARAMGIKIYTIGAGTKGYAPVPARDVWGRTVYQKVKVEIDEETLEEIARITRGRYFRATNTEHLQEIYSEIDLMEKTEIEEWEYRQYTELFVWFLIPALILLALEAFLKSTFLMRIP